MKLNELYIKNFGKFTDTKVEIADGINLIYGVNESGKSTIHTFIRGMFFGIERGRGRASVNDTFSIYEPWENPNYYAGMLRFSSGGKIFRIDRNFDRYSKSAELICEDDGEKLSIPDGDLQMLLGGLTPESYDNTVSVKQLQAGPGQSLAAELKNYATNCYSTGNGEFDLEGTFERLRNRKKELDQQVKQSLTSRQKEREVIEQEASYIWRDVHQLEGELDNLREELKYRREKEKEEKNQAAASRGMLDELRPEKWRIHPVELLFFAIAIVLPNFLIPKPLSYLASIILFLACGLYVWNRMKVGKKQEKTEPEVILEEFMPEEEKISIERLAWECDRVAGDLKDKQVQYGNLQERLTELDELSDEYIELDKKRRAVEHAIHRLKELSRGMEQRIRTRLNQRVSEIVCEITDGRYTHIVVEEDFKIGLMSGGKRVSLEQVSRGTVEQVYFALRMAADELLREEENPVILDDTFVYYDDERLAQTLFWLSRNRKQVLLFTCQKREEQAMQEWKIPYHKIECL
jgi:uncharacterized protein YhaN